jgi:hypothetical protein
MALSKTYVRVLVPNDLENQTRSLRAASGSAFTPGTLIVRVAGLAVACDTDTAVHKTLPVEMIWTDGSRFDASPRYELDGSVVEEYATLTGNIVADLAVGLFTATPVAGDVIVKSATAGKLDPLDATELAALVTADGAGLVMTQTVGRVVGAAERAGAGFYNCVLNLN